MPRMKLTELDADELEDAEYSDQDFGPDYEGEQPPAGTVLPGYIEKMWLGETGNGDDMLILIWRADETAGEYENLPVWDYLALTKEAKFRWAPFLQSVGLTIKQVIDKLVVKDEDGDNVGLVVEKIDKWAPGADNDEAYCNIITKRERYEGEWRTKVKKYLLYEAGEEQPDEPDEPEEAPPTRAARGSRSTSATTARGGRRAAQAEEEPEEDEPEEKPARPARGQRTTRSATASKPAAKATPARGRGRAARGSTDDPPF